jgi:hypothetical protein
LQVEGLSTKYQPSTYFLLRKIYEMIYRAGGLGTPFFTPGLLYLLAQPRSRVPAVGERHKASHALTQRQGELRRESGLAQLFPGESGGHDQLAPVQEQMSKARAIKAKMPMPDAIVSPTTPNKRNRTA